MLLYDKILIGPKLVINYLCVGFILLKLGCIISCNFSFCRSAGSCGLSRKMNNIVMSIICSCMLTICRGATDSSNPVCLSSFFVKSI